MDCNTGAQAQVTSHTSPLAAIAIASAIIAAIILLFVLIKRPPLVRTTKIALLFGLGVFPIIAAAGTNVEGFHTTTQRELCGSCHVMGPHAKDSTDPNSTSLAARHARNELFGAENCYYCHRDYGMYGTVLTKIGGMRHIYYQYTEFKDLPLEEATPKIHLAKPFPNRNCMHCHSGENPVFLKVPDHASAIEDIRTDRISCASAGCHGYAHPITKPDGGVEGGAPEAKRPDGGALASAEAGAPASAEAGAPVAIDASAPRDGGPSDAGVKREAGR